MHERETRKITSRRKRIFCKQKIIREDGKWYGIALLITSGYVQKSLSEQLKKGEGQSTL